MAMTNDRIERLKKHDKAEFRRFVEEFKKPVYFFLIKMLKDHEKTHDISQEVFIRVYEKIHTFKGNSALKTWVLRIASNMALTELDRLKRKRTESLDEKAHLQFITHDIIETEMSKTSLTSVIEKSLSFLTPTQEMVFRLRHLGGKSTKEAAELMDCSEGNVKKQLFLALKTIRNYLNKHYPDAEWG
jgi:RNA polymerase sigma factor (sigma-70 family)